MNPYHTHLRTCTMRTDFGEVEIEVSPQNTLLRAARSGGTSSIRLQHDERACLCNNLRTVALFQFENWEWFLSPKSPRYLQVSIRNKRVWLVRGAPHHDYPAEIPLGRVKTDLPRFLQTIEAFQQQVNSPTL
jgi:hypothetical protein